MKDYYILIRDAENLYGEIPVFEELNIPYRQHRTEIPFGSLVVGRYSVLPFYKELEADLFNKGSKLINSYQQHRFCADLGNWYEAFGPHYTPKTWRNLQYYLNDNWEGPVVLKGETNSRRDRWKTHMFAQNKQEAREVFVRLLDDGLIGAQNIYIRQYEPLKKLIDGVSGMPIPNEWRVFVLFGQILTVDYYWSSYLQDIEELGIQPERPRDSFLHKMMYFVGENANFYSMDVAQKEDGTWTLIEINDGCMSGLNGVDPKEFYTKFKQVMDNK